MELHGLLTADSLLARRHCPPDQANDVLLRLAQLAVVGGVGKRSCGDHEGDATRQGEAPGDARKRRLGVIQGHELKQAGDACESGHQHIDDGGAGVSDFDHGVDGDPLETRVQPPDQPGDTLEREVACQPAKGEAGQRPANQADQAAIEDSHNPADGSPDNQAECRPDDELEPGTIARDSGEGKRVASPGHQREGQP